MEIPRQELPEDSLPNADGRPNIRVVLNRVNSLTDKLSQAKFPPQNEETNRKSSLYFEKRSCFLKWLCLIFFLVVLPMRLKDYEFISYKVFCNLLGLSFLLLPSLQVVTCTKKQIFVFYSVRLLCSSLLFSFVSNQPLSYQFHVQSHEYDILSDTVYSILILICYYPRSNKLLIYIKTWFLINAGITMYLQGTYKTFDLAPYIELAVLGTFVFVFYSLLGLKSGQEKEIAESNAAKHFEEISKELKEIHTNLKEEEENMLARTPTSSVADEILTKIKYFKFKMLQEEKEKRFLNTKNSVFGPMKISRGSSTASLMHDKKNPKNLQLFRRLSHDTQDRSPDSEGVPQSNDSDYEFSEKKWKISASDCDILIKMVLEKQTTMYYPTILNETNNQINHETAEYLKQHFTEIGRSLLSPDLHKKNSSVTLKEPQTFTNNPWNEYLESNICTWNFDMLKFKELTNGRHLMEFGNALFKRFNVFKTLDISPNVTTSFLKDVSEGYLPNPYHNSIHGADVANSTGYFLAHEEFGGHFNELEASCLVISALVHDVGHPGFNNAFLISTKSTEALLYNDQSVLENLHSAYFFKILQKPASNILQNLNEKDYKYFRKLSIALILDTDLTKHFVILTKFKGIADQVDLKEEEKKSLFLSIALKCADIGHGAKEIPLHKKWSRRILEEFYLQGDKEKEQNIPVSPLCARSPKVANSQQGFINFVCLPLYEAFDKRFFSAKMRKEVTDQVKLNLEFWKEELQKEEKDEGTFMEETAKVLEDIKSELPLSN